MITYKQHSSFQRDYWLQGSFKAISSATMSARS